MRSRGVGNAKLAFAFLLSMPGAPFIYYGDEIGMRFVENLTSVEGGYGRTGARSPMQWDRSENAGFSTAPAEKLYIPLDPDDARPDAESQRKDPASLWNEVRKLIGIRRAHKALMNPGGIEFVCDGAAGKPLAYYRFRDDERILAVINPGAEEYTLKTEFKPGELIYLFGDEPDIRDGELGVKGRSALFMTI